MIKRHPVLFFTAFCMLSILLGLLFAWLNFLRTPLIRGEHGYQYIIPQGASIQSVVRNLSSLQIIQQPRFFNFLVYLKGSQYHLKAGEYFFPRGTTPSMLLKQITTGTGLVYHTFTIIPGWSFKRLMKALLEEQNLKHLTLNLSDEKIMQELGHSALHPEGQFFPDTYYFVKGSSDIALLKRAFQRMQTILKTAWQRRDPLLPYQTPNEALIVASLVEKETAIDHERPIIAGVILNRLKKNMLLQIDPTVIYAAGLQFSGIIRKQNLLSSNPYNTYAHKGLPPSPIAMPSLKSLEAALHPQKNDYLYFVAKNDLSESHQFSKTLVEHNYAVTLAKKRKSIPTFFNEELIQNYFLNINGIMKQK